MLENFSFYLLFHLHFFSFLVFQIKTCNIFSKFDNCQRKDNEIIYLKRNENNKIDVLLKYSKNIKLNS